MSSSKYATKLHDILLCAVCKDTVEKPCTFPCFHSFCTKCVQQLTTTNEGNETGVRCPICNAFSGENYNQSSFLVKELLDMHCKLQEGDNKCQNCLECEGDWRCVDCKMDLCDKCKITHIRIPICRNHRIVEKSTVDEIVVDSLVFCTIHKDDPVQFNCKDCEKPICIKCKVTRHENHQTETIEDTLERIVPEIKQNRSKLDDKIALLAESSKDITAKMDEIKEDFTTCRDEARNNLNELIEKLKMQHQDMMKQLDTKEQEELTKLEVAKLDVDSKNAECTKVSEWVNTSIEAARGVTLMSELQSGLCNKVLNLIKSGPSKPVVVQSPKFVANKELQDMKDIVGGIIHNSTYTGEKNVLQKIQCESFEKLFESELEHDDNHIKLLGSATRLDIINGNIWVPIPSNNCIQVWGASGDLVNTIQNNTTPRSVRQASNEDIILASDSGLHIIDEDGKIIQQLQDGKFCDVSVVGNMLAAQCYGNNSIYIYKFEYNLWNKPFVINAGSVVGAVSLGSTLCFSSGMEVCLTLRNGRKNIYQFNINGQCMGGHGCTSGSNLSICGPDKNRNVLMCCSSSFSIFKPNNNSWKNINVKDIGQSFDAVFDEEGSVWVLHMYKGSYCITRYKHA